MSALLRNVAATLACLVAVAHGPYSPAAGKDKPITKDEAAQKAISAVGGGRLLGIRAAGGDENDIEAFEVKVLSADGHVRMVRVSGRTGAVLKQ